MVRQLCLHGGPIANSKAARNDGPTERSGSLADLQESLHRSFEFAKVVRPCDLCWKFEHPM